MVSSQMVEEMKATSGVLILIKEVADRKGMDAVLSDIKEAIKEHPGTIGDVPDYEKVVERGWKGVLEIAKMMCEREAEGRKSGKLEPGESKDRV